MRFLIQAPNFVGIFTFPGWWFPDIVPSFIFQFQLVSSEWNFHTREPREVIFLALFLDLKWPWRIFPIFSSESTHHAMTFPEKNFWFQPKAIFLMIFSSLRNLLPFCSTIRISLLSPWTLIPLKPSAFWLYLSRSWKMYFWKCVRDMSPLVAKGSWL